MAQLKNLLKKANSLLERRPIPWGKADNETKTIAMALLVDWKLIDDIQAFSNRHDILHQTVCPERLRNTLVQAHNWWEYTHSQADATSREIGATLKKLRGRDTEKAYATLSMSTKDLVAAYEIETNKQAADIATRLQEMTENDECSTALFKGLLSCLCAWNQTKAYGAAKPGELKKIRNKKYITQAQAAKFLGITHRQYCRYETGESPIPKDRYKALEKATRIKILKMTRRTSARQSASV